MPRCKLLFCLLLLCLVTGTARAAAPAISVTETFGQTEITVQARYKNNKYTLSIPGCWDITRIPLSLEGKGPFRVGKNGELREDAPADLTGVLGKNQKLYNSKNGSLGTISILHGAPLPALFITVDSKQLSQVNRSKDNEITDGRIVYQEADGSITYDGALSSFKGRGNSTFAYSKKPYQFKLPQKADLSGMGRAKTWLLIANWEDLSLLRNQICLDLAKDLQLPYAIDCQPVDVYINGIYNGLYLLTEKVQIGKERVNITDLEEATEAVNDTPVSEAKYFNIRNKKGIQILRGYDIPNDPEDITGGYILEIEKSYRFREKIKNGFKTEYGLSVTVKEPTYVSRAQLTYISDWFDDFHKAALADDGVSPATGKAYTDYIDLPSFARKFWIEEFSKNYDALASSQFFFKDSDRVDGKLYAGPCWDYDLSLGDLRISGFYNGSLPEKDYVVTTEGRDNLYRQLMKHPDFKAEVARVYREELVPLLDILLGEGEAKGGRVHSFDDYASAIEASAEMNFVRWPEGSVKGYYTGSGTTHSASVKYLKQFIQKRYAYLNSVWLTD